MKLYDFNFAPNPTRVRVYLAEKGIAVEIVPVDLTKGAQRSAEFLRMNPRAGVPLLELDDGTLLPESLAIMEYLEELHPEPPMIGRTPLERAFVRVAERRAETILHSIGRLFHATHAVIPGRKVNPAVAENERPLAGALLTALDREIGTRPFVAGERPTIADCTLFAALRFAGLGQLEIPGERPNIERWLTTFLTRPSANA